MMLILFGKNGQVAQEVQIAAASQSLPLQVYSSEDVDFRNPAAVERVLLSAPPESIVINAAAYTQVDQAESDESTARQINALTPEIMARTCALRNFKLIHLSTDYVFSGEKSGPYQVDDATGPIGVYGATKLEGEQRIQNALPQSILLRTSWVFSAHGKNFVKTMLRVGAQKTELSVVADQTGGPTSAKSIARTCLKLAGQIRSLDPQSDQWGIYHYSGAPTTTWCGFAEEIFRQEKLPVTVNPIPTRDYPTPAKRPANSSLDCRRLLQNFQISQPDWQQDLAEVIQQLHDE